MNNIPPKVQNQLSMLQQVQQQLQTIMQQKSNFEMAAKEAKKAQEELGNVSEDADVFVTIGTVMMQKNKESVSSDLADKIETLELRIKSLEKQEKMLQTKFEQIQQQIQAAMQGGNPVAD
ncbi:prefoldin subunit beta [Methanoplanus sp. FWC-SCC4]|uniref:Prefoldin subunit beta n=1 Tax=Methanochimaera problematica TaxID=2609417 RepID=A0AA97FFB9_9EURY|nr:prefoldin subunit beta [Methanoplanus sp. FWC-SCC4]WOF16401.1 prefoldin subunit beta [Methanoplanus sp. FWC-SCC4]